MIGKIIYKNIVNKKLNSALTILLMAFGVLIVCLVLQISKQVNTGFSKNLKGIDMVVGAKGSPLQLILSSVFQIDNPTGNIKLSDFNSLKANPLIKKAIPISMGDNHAGFRIVGTTPAYLDHFKAIVDHGKLNTTEHEVVIGSKVAEILKLNQTFESAHGLDKDGEKHDHGFKVVGILKPNGSVVDKLIITNLESIWELHGGHETPDQEKEISSGLISFRSPLGLMTLPKNINANTNMMAALPAIEANRLFELMGQFLDLLKYLAWAIIVISGISVFVTLYNALLDRKYEIALLLSLGAKRLQVFLILLGEGIILCIAGFALGFLLSRIFLIFGQKIFGKQLSNFVTDYRILTDEIYVLALALFVGIFAALLPSIGVYKVKITETLANE